MRIVTVGSAAAAVREVYLHAAKAIGLEPSELALIAAHDWDINGKQSGAGHRLRRTRAKFSPAMQEPNVSGNSVQEVARELISLLKR